MTVSTTVSYASYLGNDATVSFPFPFKILQEEDLTVQLRNASTGAVVKTYVAGEYTVTGVGYDAGGYVTILGTPISSTYRLFIQREVDFNQLTDLVNQSGFYPDSVENEFDHKEMEIQQLKLGVDRSLKVPVGETVVDLPAASYRANKFLLFDTVGQPLMSSGTGADAGLRADLAAVTGQRLIGGSFEDVAELLADTTLSHATADAGVPIRTRKEGFAYEVASEVATDAHVTTAGGLKLYTLVGSDGSWQAAAFGVSPDNDDNANQFEAMRDALIGIDRAAHHIIRWPRGVLKTSRNRLFDGLLRYTLEASGAILQNTSTSDQLSAFAPIGPREGVFRVSGHAETGILYFTGHRFDTTVAGATSVTLTNLIDASNYAVGDNVMLGGFAAQRQGYSPNLRFFEYAKVAAVAGAVITLTEPILENYDEDWPDFNYSNGGTTGSITLGVQYVGKPRILNLSGRPQGDGTAYYWPEFVHIKDLLLRKNPTAVTTNRFAIPGKHVILENVGWEEELDVGIDARENDLVEWNGLTCPQGAEPDKLVGTLIIRGGQFGNNPTNQLGLANGVGVKNIILQGVRVTSRISLAPRDGMTVIGGQFTSVHRSDSSLQGPFMPALFGSASLIVSGATLATKGTQKKFGTTTSRLTRTYTVTNIDAAGAKILVPWSDIAEPDTFLRHCVPGRAFWDRADPRVRGRLASMKDSGTGFVEITFVAGSINYAIKAGIVTVGSEIEFYYVDRVVIDGAEFFEPTDLQRPYPGLLRWEEMELELPWTIAGVTLSETGAGIVNDTVTIPATIRPGGVYNFKYDLTRVAGSVVIRASGSATNIVSLNATAIATVELAIPSDADDDASLEIRSGTFSGSITPISLTKVD